MRRKISLFFLGVLVCNLTFMAIIFSPVWHIPFDSVQLSFGTTLFRHFPDSPVNYWSDGKFGSDITDDSKALWLDDQLIETHREPITTVSVITPGTPHGPIEILGDDNFHLTAALESWSGYGNATDPYIIENYDIDINGASYHGISISYTSLYFIIRGCTIQNANLTGYAGIYLENVLNGELRNNNCTQNDLAGIWLDNTNATKIASNYCNYNIGAGISVVGDGIPGYPITDNTCNGNGGAGISVVGDGIPGYPITDNTCNGNGGAGIQASLMIGTVPVPDVPCITDNTCNDNGGAGIHSNVMIDTVPLPESPVISQNLCDNNDGDGIWSQFMIGTWPTPEMPLLEENLCTNNGGNGITIINTVGTPTPAFMPSNPSNYRGSSTTRQADGTFTITQNTCSNNDDYGLHLTNNSTSIMVSWNSFANNAGNNVVDDGTDNVFSLNYYSDYTGSDGNDDGIGDTAYAIPGTAGNQDTSPLMHPHTTPLPTTTTSPIPGFPIPAVALGIISVLGITLLIRRRRQTK